MAEAMLDEAVSDSDRLRGAVKTESAGTFAFDGSEPAKNACTVMYELGLRIDRHRAQQVTQELGDWADMVLTMDVYGLEQMQVMFPEAADKMALLKQFVEEGAVEKADEEYYNIDDPYGEDLDTYRACAAEIRSCIEKLIQRLERAPEI